MIRNRSRWRVYALAALVAALAAAARLFLPGSVRDTLPFLGFFAAIVVASGYGGLGPGLLATVLSTGAAYVLLPVDELRIGGATVAGSLVRFLLVGAVVSWLNDRLVRARELQQQSIEQLAAQNESLRRGELAQRHLAALVESSDDSILSLDVDGIITSWNRGAERMYGWTAEEAIGQSVSFVVAPDRRAAEDQILARIWAGDHGEQFDTERLRKDGTRFEVAVRISPIRDASGRIIGVSKIARDITERRRADRMRDELLAREQEARAEAVAARDRLAFLAEVSAVLTSSLDYDETLDRAVHIALPRLGDFCNVLVEDEHQLRHAAWGHINRGKEPLMREVVRRLTDPQRSRPDIPTVYERVMQTGKPVVVDHNRMAAVIAQVAAAGVDSSFVQQTRELGPYSYIGMPLLVHGRTIGVISFGTGERESRRDYTDADVMLAQEVARRVSPAIENSRLFRQADQLNRLKDEFLATLSHELRTPLSAILGWARMLAANQLDADGVVRAVQAIERNAQAQSQIVEDILDLAQGTAGNLRLEMKPVDLASVAHRGVDAIAPAAAAKRLVVDVNVLRPVAVIGDAGRLQQVAWNLLSNAVKFTNPGGRIAVDIGTNDGTAELSVADTGIGISAGFLPYVFDKFRQADGSFTRKHGGLGLGLAIAKHLVELHGGSIEARSDGDDRGATFVVRLPLPSRSPEP